MGDRLIRGKGREIDEGVAPAAGVSSLGKSRGFFLVSYVCLHTFFTSMHDSFLGTFPSKLLLEL